MIWRICERFNMKPPGVKDSFEKCPGPIQAQLLAYENIREYEELSEGGLL